MRRVMAGLSLLVLGVAALHAKDAIEEGESLVPVAMALVVGLGLVLGPLAFASRGGPDRAAERSATLTRWAIPVLIVVTALRVVASMFGR